MLLVLFLLKKKHCFMLLVDLVLLFLKKCVIITRTKLGAGFQIIFQCKRRICWYCECISFIIKNFNCELKN
jgi:hypothetical protein